MEDLPSIIRKLLRVFEENFKTLGNIWGFKIAIPQALGQKVAPSEETIILSTNETLLRAVKEAIFEFLAHEEAECLYAEKLSTNELRRFVEDNLEKNMRKYLSVIEKLKSLAKTKNMGFVHLNISLAPELMHFAPDTHKTLISPILDGLHRLAGRELVVYDPLEYLVLKAYESQINKKVYHFLERINFEKHSLSERFIVKDPCILSRRANIDLRKFINSILENLIHHPLSGNLTICCGEFMWITAPRIALNNAREILRILSSYSPRIITLCPSAMFLFSVAQRFFDDIRDIRIVDLLEIITPGRFA